MRPDTAVNTQKARLKRISTGNTLKLRKYFQSKFSPEPTGSWLAPGRVNIPKMLSAINMMAAVDTMVQVYRIAFPFVDDDAATIK